MLGELTSAEIENVLKRNLVGRLGCHTDGLVYVVPISYSYDGTYIYGRTAEGMKIDILRRNPEVCFEVDELRNMANWESVIAWGKFEELTQNGERNKALLHLSNRMLPFVSSETTHLHPLWPFLPEKMESIKGIVFRILIEKKTGRFEHTDEAAFFAT